MRLTCSRYLLYLAIGLATALPARAQCTGCNEASFGPAARSYLSAGAATSAVSADFNGDGVPDVAILPYSFLSNIDHLAILIGDGKGGFLPPVTYPISPAISPPSLVAGDFDSDGKIDLILGSSMYGQPVIFRGVGDGTFLPPQALNFAPSVGALSAADFNGDGKLDLIDVYGEFVTIFFGDGQGNFPSSVLLPSGGAFNRAPTAIVGDFNGDGISDFVIPNFGGNTVAVFLGTSMGPFAPGRLYPAGDDPQGVAVGRLTSSNRLDLVARARDGVEVLLGTGTGSFAAPIHYPVPGDTIYGGAIWIADFDGDGKNDVFVGDSYIHYFFQGNGAGGLIGPTGIQSTAFPTLIEDFDGDGLPDIGYAVSGFLVRRNRGGPASMFPPTLAPGYGPSVVLVGDFNEDGRDDIVTVGDDANYFAATANGFDAPVSLRAGFSSAAAVADFNHDGHLDVVTSNSFGTVLYLGDGHGGFQETGTNLPPVPGPRAMSARDFNGDFIPDLLIGDWGSGNLYFFPGIGGGSFGDAILSMASPNLIGLAVDDFNADGKIDVAVTTTSGVSVLFGDGAGHFSAGPSFSISQPIGPIVAGDFDNDGKKDFAILISTSYGHGSLQIFWGDGHGAFTAGTPFVVGPFPSGLAFADFNQDGLPDLVVAGGSSLGSIPFSNGFWMNDGNRGFVGSTAFETGGSDSGAFSGGAAVVGDFNHDGLPDVAAGWQTFVTILYNTNCKARDLVEMQEPAACNVPGTSFSPQPQLEVVDDGGNRVQCDSGVVTASLFAGPAGAVLGGTKTIAASSGLATFTNLSVNKTGTGYQIDFTHPAARKFRSLKFTAGLTVSITGPSLVCQGVAAVFSAGAVYDSYMWQVDGVPATTFGQTLSVIGLSPGPHMVALTVSKDRCSVSNSTSVQILAAPDPTVTTIAVTCPFSSGLAASVPDAGPGATYFWTVANGVITAGQGTTSITFSAGPYGQTNVSATVQNAQNCTATGTQNVTIDATLSCPQPVGFFTVPPCRLVDTRGADGPALSANVDRTYTIVGRCGIPASATALSLNITVTQPTQTGSVTVRPGNTPLLAIPYVNYRAGQTRANNAIIALGAAGDYTVTCTQPFGSTQFILDVNGYFQ